MARLPEDSLFVAAVFGKYNSENKSRTAKDSCKAVRSKSPILPAARGLHEQVETQGVKKLQDSGIRRPSADVTTKGNSKNGNKQRRRKKLRLTPGLVHSRHLESRKPVALPGLPAVESKSLCGTASVNRSCKRSQKSSTADEVKYFQNSVNVGEFTRQGISPADLIMVGLIERHRVEQTRAMESIRTSFLKGTSALQASSKEVRVKLPPIDPPHATNGRKSIAGLAEEIDDLKNTAVNGTYKPILQRQRRAKIQ